MQSSTCKHSREECQLKARLQRPKSKINSSSESEVASTPSRCASPTTVQPYAHHRSARNKARLQYNTIGDARRATTSARCKCSGRRLQLPYRRLAKWKAADSRRPARQTFSTRSRISWQAPVCNRHTLPSPLVRTSLRTSTPHHVNETNCAIVP